MAAERSPVTPLASAGSLTALVPCTTGAIADLGRHRGSTDALELSVLCECGALPEGCGLLGA